MIERLDDFATSQTNVISWGSPVPSFGNLANSTVATIGLNPSNKEFVDENGEELVGAARRFHTLNSLGLERWSEIDDEHLNLIGFSCNDYFKKNPYDRWFKKLDYLISGVNASYYSNNLLAGDYQVACHLDLIPYATACKWTDLPFVERSELISHSGDTLGQLIRNSPIQLLVLNGQSVVDQFEKVAGINLIREERSDWTLPRKNMPGVKGVAYSGLVKQIFGMNLNREIRVVGYNHNIQSSFGVTLGVIDAIRNWIAKSVA